MKGNPQESPVCFLPFFPLQPCGEGSAWWDKDQVTDKDSQTHLLNVSGVQATLRILGHVIPAGTSVAAVGTRGQSGLGQQCCV